MNVKLRYIWEITYHQTKSIPFHSHNFNELIYYIQADGYSEVSFKNNFDIDQKNISYTPPPEGVIQKVEFKDGDLIHYAPGTIHNEVHLNHPAKLVCIGFEFENSYGSLPTKPIHDNNAAFRHLFDRITKLHSEKNEYYVLSIENIISEILVELLKMNKYKSSVNSKLDYILNYINDYPASTTSVDQLAKSVGFSVEHFRSIFKNYVGMSPKQYISTKRIEHAKLLLSTPDLSLNDVAYLCGYTDYVQFSKFFKKETKLSPSTYRSKLITDSTSKENTHN